jgi:type II secretory pathway component PulF
MVTTAKGTAGATPEMAAHVAHVAEAQHELDDELTHIADLRRELEHAEHDVQHKVGEIYSELARMCALDDAERQSAPTER